MHDRKRGEGEVRLLPRATEIPLDRKEWLSCPDHEKCYINVLCKLRAVPMQTPLIESKP